MPRKVREIPPFFVAFPIERLWENERSSWEGDFGKDPIGNDLDARLWTVREAIKCGCAPPDAEETLIRKSQIKKLIEPLRDINRSGLARTLWQIAGRHLRPRHMEILGSGPEATIDVLDDILAAAEDLEDAIERLPIIVRQFLTDVFQLIPKSYRNRQTLDIVELEYVLPDLGHVSLMLRDALARERKRPPKVLRKQTLLDAANAIQQATGHEIHTRWSVDGERCFAFKGVEGEALLAFMRLVEPGVSEMALVKEFRVLSSQLKETTPDK